MLTPDQLNKYPDNLVKLYTQAEMDIIADMARRIATYDYFIPAAEFQYRKMIEMGNVHDDIFKRLSAVTGRRVEELEQLFEEAGYQTLKVDDDIYRSVGLDPAEFNQSPALQNILKAGLQNTNGLFENLTRTSAKTGSKQFERVLDRAYMQIVNGSFDSETAIRRAVKSLSEKGVAAIEYPTGHRNYIESAVRRATLSGVNQTAMKLQDARADEMGCDLVETSAHAGARPSHALWQGKVFSRSGSHKIYPDFRETTGYGTGAGLGGWECRHNFYPFFEGISTRAYSEKDLEEMEAEKYTYNGKKMNEAEALDKQRYIERNIRRWKREYSGMKAAGQPVDEAAAKISQWNRIHDDFLDQTGMKKQVGRIQTGKFTKSDAGYIGSASKKIAPYRKLAGVETSTGIKITEVSKHFESQGLVRKVSKNAAEDALKNPLKIGKIRVDRTQHFIGEGATVVVNVDTGKVVTTWTTSSSKAKKLKGSDDQ